MHARYTNRWIRQLRDQQVRFAPRVKKFEQVHRAEKFLGEIDPERDYSFEYVFYRITGYRPDTTPHEVLAGEDVRHDVRLFIEDVTDAADMSAEEAGEPVYTVADLGKMFNVSTKTISRWRQQGLVSRRFMFEGRKRVGFLKSSVDRFVAQNRERVQRGARFSQLTDEEREEMIALARRLARAGGCPSDVTRRIAERMGRSVETIRYTLKEYDRNNRELAIFPGHGGPLSDKAKQEMYQLHREGVSPEKIARRHCRSVSSVHRILNEARAQQIMELPLEYMFSEEFAAADAERVIMAPVPEADKPFRRVKVPPGLPPYLAALYDVPLLTREQERHIFRQMNFLKYRAQTLREKLDVARPRSSLMDQIEQIHARVVRIKNQIVQANLRLVVSIAKRHVSPSENFFDLVSDGNMSLIRAVEKFDYTRGNKFSTYASWAIMKNFARTIPNEFKYRDRFRTSQEEMFSGSEDLGTNPYLQESTQRLREKQIGRILARLDDREQKIIISRFGLDHHREPLTLKEVGAELGVTKERIRQIEARALNKLLAAAREERVEVELGD